MTKRKYDGLTKDSYCLSCQQDGREVRLRLIILKADENNDAFVCPKCPWWILVNKGAR